MKLNIQGKDFLIEDLHENNLNILSEKLSNRQQNDQFMKFLKDTPMSPDGNRKILKTKLSDTKNVSKLIIEKTQQEIAGFILFDEFDASQNSLESYTRIDPGFGKLGLGSQCRKMIIENLLLSGEIDKIISWHSAENKGSLCINRNAGFKIIDFITDKTFLPNINERTDDFKWEITKDDILYPAHTDIIKNNHEKVIEGLIKHDLIHLLKQNM